MAAPSARRRVGLQNLSAWLNTVVGRVCLDMLRSRLRSAEEPWEEHLPEPIIDPLDAIDPEHQALLAGGRWPLAWRAGFAVRWRSHQAGIARAPILLRYLQVAPGGRAHIPTDRRASLEEYERIAAQYPVFRVCLDRAA